MRFGVPNTLILDNRLKFDNKAFKKYFSDLGIKNRYLTPAYPQSNRQAEAMNKAIVNGLKKRLEGAKGKWAEDLPNVLWAYRTTSRRSTSETSFSLTFGMEAIIPVEIGLSSMRTANFSPSTNDIVITQRLDLLKENREIASIRLANYQQKLAWGYNRNVKLKEFIAGDLILWRALRSMKESSLGKLALN